MADKEYRYTNSETNDIFTALASTGYTPSIGDIVKVHSNGTVSTVSAVTDRPFLVVDYTTNGSGYVVSLMNTGTINANGSDTFTTGGVYYSDGDGTMSTATPSASAGVCYIVGTAVTSTQMKVTNTAVRY